MDSGGKYFNYLLIVATRKFDNKKSVDCTEAQQNFNFYDRNFYHHSGAWVHYSESNGKWM